jgi:hypothetical protein
LDPSQDPQLFIGSKEAKEELQQQSKPTIRNSPRIKGVHSVVFQIDQVGPSLDRDLNHDENLSFRCRHGNLELECQIFSINFYSLTHSFIVELSIIFPHFSVEYALMCFILSIYTRN